MIARFTAPLIAKIFAGLSLALTLACAVLWASTSHYKHKFENEHIARENDRKAYELAAKEAEAKAIAAKIQTENRYAELARKADSLTQSRERLLSAADRYARNHIVRPEGVGCTPGRAPTPSQGDPAKGGDGRGEATELVAVNRNDFDLLVANSARLEDVRRWGEGLIDEGLAIPEVEFGK